MENELPTQNLTTVTYTKFGTTAPTPSTISFTGAGQSLYRVPLNIALGATATGSVWLSGTPGDKINLYVMKASALVGTGVQITLTSTPTCYQVTGSAGAGFAPIFFLDNRSFLGIPVGTSVMTVTATSLQFEDVTGQSVQTASKYVPSTENSTGALGVKYFETDYAGNPIPQATLLGYFAEPAATNRILQSGSIANASWTKRGTAAAVPGYPDLFGGLTGELVTVGAPGVNDIYQIDTGFVVSSLPSLSIALRQVTTSGTLYVSAPQGGAYGTWTINLALLPTTLTIITSSHACVTVINPFISNAVGNCGVQFYCAAGCQFIHGGTQQEDGNIVTSYIPTITAAVTRNADVDTYQTAGNIGTTGTVYLEFTPTHAPAGTIALWGSYTDANNSTQVIHDGTNIIMRKRIAGVNYDATKALTYVAGTTYKIAARAGTGGQHIAVDGVLGTANANATAAVVSTTMQPGADGNGGQQPTANIRKWYTWTDAKTDAQLAQITS